MDIERDALTRIRDCQPYSRSASVYNAMMAEVDYLSWADYILDILEEEGLGNDSLCDISCGTGLLLAQLQGEFGRLQGYDSSEEMIRIMERDLPQISCAVADMNALPEDEDFTVWVNVHDALNYLPGADALQAHLQGMADRLSSGALYLFDFALPPLIDRHFLALEEEGEGPEGEHFLRKSHWNPDRMECLTEIYLSLAEDRETIYLEKHVQKIYTYAEIRDICSRIEGVHITLLEEFSFEAATADSERILGIMRHDQTE